MKTILVFLTTFGLVFSFLSFKSQHSFAMSGVLEIPAKGELRVWKNEKHARIQVKLSNGDAKQSVELYTVNSSGREKWINPSLLANTCLTINIPANGHLFIKNFNPNTFKVTYTILN